MPAGGPLRTCVVGMGAISAAMWPALAAHPRLEIAAVVDPHPQARTRVPADSEVSVHDSLADAMRAEDLQLAVINSPAEYHVAQVNEGLAGGLDVIVAKPLSPRLSEARELTRTAKRLSRSLAVAEQVRYNVHYQRAAGWVRDGLIGQVESVILVNAKPRPDPGTLADAEHPALDENACHHFDALRCVLNERQAVSVSCHEFNPSWSPYRRGAMVNATITYEDGVEVLYQGGFAARAPMYELRLEGTQGVLRCRGEHMSRGPMSYEHSGDGHTFVELPGHAPIRPADAWTPFVDAWDAWHRTGGVAPFSAEGALPILALVEAAKRSATTGTVAAVERPGPL
jgi:predicted dehydrogenase